MWSLIAKGCMGGLIIVAVSAVSQRYPRLGALLLSLPVVSVLAFCVTWTEHRDLPAISRLARETLVLVLLGLPFLLPLACADRLGLGFWSAFGCGILLAIVVVGGYLFAVGGWGP